MSRLLNICLVLLLLGAAAALVGFFFMAAEEDEPMKLPPYGGPIRIEPLEIPADTLRDEPPAPPIPQISDEPESASEHRMRRVLETWIRSGQLPDRVLYCPLPATTAVLGVHLDEAGQSLRLDFSSEVLDHLDDDLWADGLIDSLWAVVEAELAEARHLFVYIASPETGELRPMQSYQNP